MTELTLVTALTAGAIGMVVGVAKTGISGLGILIVPVMALLFPARESVGALLPLLLVGDLNAVTYYRGQARWPQLFRLAPGIVAGMLCGSYLLYRLDNASLRWFLGVLVLVLVGLELASPARLLQKIGEHPVFALLMGLAAGVGTTVGNAAGPVMGMYLLLMGLRKEQFMGTAAWFYLLVNVTKLPIFISLGMLTERTLPFILCGAPFVFLGSLLGRRLLRVLSQRQFQQVVRGFALLAALWLIGR